MTFASRTVQPSGTRYQPDLDSPTQRQLAAIDQPSSYTSKLCLSLVAQTGKHTLAFATAADEGDERAADQKRSQNCQYRNSLCPPSRKTELATRTAIAVLHASVGDHFSERPSEG